MWYNRDGRNFGALLYATWRHAGVMVTTHQGLQIPRGLGSSPDWDSPFLLPEPPVTLRRRVPDTREMFLKTIQIDLKLRPFIRAPTDLKIL